MTSAQGPGMEATRSDALWSGENGARVISFLTLTGPSVPCCSNRPHVPAGPSVPRSVPGQPPHLQVKRARYRCKSSSLLPLSTPAPPTVVLVPELLVGASLSISLLLAALHTFDSCPCSPQRQQLVPPHPPSFLIHSTDFPWLCFPTELLGPIIYISGICLLREHKFVRRSVSQSTLCPAWHSS